MTPVIVLIVVPIWIVAILFVLAICKVAGSADVERPTTHPEIILQHAITYLEPYGIGRNLEFSRARWILQYALDEVKRG